HSSGRSRPGTTGLAAKIPWLMALPAMAALAAAVRGPGSRVTTTGSCGSPGELAPARLESTGRPLDRSADIYFPSTRWGPRTAHAVARGEKAGQPGRPRGAGRITWQPQY